MTHFWTNCTCGATVCTANKPDVRTHLIMKDLLLSDSLKGAERQETKLFSSALHTQTFCLLRFVSSKRTRSKKKKINMELNLND